MASDLVKRNDITKRQRCLFSAKEGTEHVWLVATALHLPCMQTTYQIEHLNKSKAKQWLIYTCWCSI